MARLGDLIEQIRGVSYKPEDVYDRPNEDSIALLRANNIKDGQLNFDDVIYVSRKRVHDNQLLKAGDILICTSSGSKELVGKAAYVQEDLPITFGAFCKVIRPQKIRSDYLGHFFNSPNYRKKISASSAGANINNIRNEHIDELEIVYPAVDRQEFVAVVLDKLTDLISLRKQQLAKLDELVRARFVEMFGEPVCNSKKLPTERGENFFKLSNGKFVPESRRFEVGIPAYGGNGISWYTDDAIMKRDTLVVGRVGFQSGNVHFAKGPLWITDNAMYISNYNTEMFDLFFLYSLMEHIDFTRFQDAGDLKKITQKPFMNMEYIMPPMSLQREYVDFAEQANKSKLTIRQSLNKLEVLKKSLMQEYFG